MADMRLYCAVFAVTLIAASTAKPYDGEDGQQDSRALKELLGAMKRYLYVKDQGISSRTNAHNDVKTVYDSCKIYLGVTTTTIIILILILTLIIRKHPQSTNYRQGCKKSFARNNINLVIFTVRQL